MLYVNEEPRSLVPTSRVPLPASSRLSRTERLENGGSRVVGEFCAGIRSAGRLARIPVVVVMLDRTSQYKVDAARKLGAEVVFCGLDTLARQPTVEAIARERGMVAIDTWEDPAIAIGHVEHRHRDSGRFLGRGNGPRTGKQRRGSGRHSRGHQRRAPRRSPLSEFSLNGRTPHMFRSKPASLHRSTTGTVSADRACAVRPGSIRFGCCKSTLMKSCW